MVVNFQMIILHQSTTTNHHQPVSHYEPTILKQWAVTIPNEQPQLMQGETAPSGWETLQCEATNGEITLRTGPTNHWDHWSQPLVGWESPTWRIAWQALLPFHGIHSLATTNKQPTAWPLVSLTFNMNSNDLV